MSQSPFKFLDSYTREDRDIFFGNPSEKKEFAAVIKTLAESDLQCRFMSNYIRNLKR